MERIAAYIATRPDAHHLGVLLGSAHTHNGQRWIAVTDVITVDDAAAARAPVSSDDAEVELPARLGADVLAAMEKVWEKRHPGSVVCGWFQAAPEKEGLAEVERFNHRRLFPHPWQIALVIDTVHQASRLYRWDGEQLATSQRYYYWDMTPRPETVAELTRSAGAALPNEHHIALTRIKPRKRGFPWYLVAAAILLYMLIPHTPGGLVSLQRSLAKEAEELAVLKDELLRLEEEHLALMVLAAETESAIRATLTVHARSDQEAEDHGAPAPFAPTAAWDGQEYVIQPGDTMWRISATLIGDPKAYHTLAQTNEIENPDLIFPGQRLRMPGER